MSFNIAASDCALRSASSALSLAPALARGSLRSNSRRTAAIHGSLREKVGIPRQNPFFALVLFCGSSVFLPWRGWKTQDARSMVRRGTRLCRCACALSGIHRLAWCTRWAASVSWRAAPSANDAWWPRRAVGESTGAHAGFASEVRQGPDVVDDGGEIGAHLERPEHLAREMLAAPAAQRRPVAP